MSAAPTPASGGPRPGRRRVLWILLAAVVVLVVVAALALPWLLDVERFRGRIEEGLRSATGWQAELGSMDFSVLHGMVLTVSPATLRSPGEDGSSVSLERIEVSAALRPLLGGRLEVNRVALVGPDIRLVRKTEEEGWILPLGETAAEPAQAADSSFSVTVERVSLNGGRLTLDDRAGQPPLSFELIDLDLTLEPESGRISGGGRLGADGGSLSWEGDPANGFAIELDDLRTELLQPWTGPDLVHAGGRLGGSLKIALPLAIEGDLTARGLELLAGEKPFDTAAITFHVETAGETWRLEGLTFEGDGARLTGTGELLPALDLEMTLPATPLGVALAASRSVLPLPLEVEPPGEVEARLFVDQSPDGELSYEARGTLSAASFRAAEMLPPARDVRAAFDLRRDGSFEVRVLEGQVAGGPLTGTARLDSVSPPGTLVFDGGIADAALGQLLAGFVGDASGRVSGPTGLTARLGVDLSQPEIGARSLGGRLDLDSRQVQLPGWDLESAIRDELEQQLQKRLGPLSALVGQKLDERVGGKAAEGAREVVEQLFDSVDARIDFDAWPWRLERLAMRAGGLSTEGSGTFDPDQGAVDLRFTARLDEAKTTELVRETKELRMLVDPQGRLSLPLEVSGPLLGPTIGVDVGDALSRQLGEASKEDAVRGLIKGLLDRKKKE